MCRLLRSYPKGYCVLFLAVLIQLTSGCDDVRRHGSGAGVDFGEAQAPLSPDAAPDAVSMAALDAIRVAQENRAKGLGSPDAKAQYESAMQTLRSLAARAEIHERVKNSGSMSIPRDITEKGAVTMTIEGWVSTLAKYVEGYELNSMVTSIVTPDHYANSYLNAEDPRDKAILDELQSKGQLKDDELRKAALAKGVCPPIAAGIEIRLKRVDGEWRVLKIGIGPARLLSTSISLPATGVNTPTNPSQTPALQPASAPSGQH